MARRLTRLKKETNQKSNNYEIKDTISNKPPKVVSSSQGMGEYLALKGYKNDGKYSLAEKQEGKVTMLVNTDVTSPVNTKDVNNTLKTIKSNMNELNSIALKQIKKDFPEATAKNVEAIYVANPVKGYCEFDYDGGKEYGSHILSVDVDVYEKRAGQTSMNG